MPVTETAGKNCKDINSSIIPEAHALLRSPYDPGIRPPYKRLETVDMTATPDGEPLMHTSYICYHGLVTFEHNVSVFVIGNIKKDHFMRVEDGVNRFWASEQNNQGELETGSDGTWDEEPIQELRHKSSLPWIMSNSASDTSLVESRHSRPPASRSASASTGTKPDLEAMRARLYRAAASSPQEYKDDSFCFPFSALPDDSNYALEPARGRVKIDTGARENWISTRFLKRASITFTRDDSLGTYRGANGESFKPLGFVLVTWYSINQALTSIDNFLVGKDTPFDAILGSDWVDEYGLDGFREAVLPLRLVMSKDRSSDLKKRQAETGAANKNVADHQRAQSRSLREQNRKKQAGSRTTSRIEDSSDFDSQESTYRASSSSARHR